MSLLEELRRKDEILKAAGDGIRADARSKGATFSYINPDQPDLIVVETADGAQHAVTAQASRRAIK